jgi:hypothetical protein
MGPKKKPQQHGDCQGFPQGGDEKRLGELSQRIGLLLVFSFLLNGGLNPATHSNPAGC